MRKFFGFVFVAIACAGCAATHSARSVGSTDSQARSAELPYEEKIIYAASLGSGEKFVILAYNGVNKDFRFGCVGVTLAWQTIRDIAPGINAMPFPLAGLWRLADGNVLSAVIADDRVYPIIIRPDMSISMAGVEGASGITVCASPNGRFWGYWADASDHFVRFDVSSGVVARTVLNAKLSYRVFGAAINNSGDVALTASDLVSSPVEKLFICTSATEGFTELHRGATFSKPVAALTGNSFYVLTSWLESGDHSQSFIRFSKTEFTSAKPSQLVVHLDDVLYSKNNNVLVGCQAGYGMLDMSSGHIGSSPVNGVVFPLNGDPDRIGCFRRGSNTISVLQK
ncbi:hypothetical protein BH11PLA1_BH11PLA1_21040 [soil metagenome]